jgi:hypothetical protein
MMWKQEFFFYISFLLIFIIRNTLIVINVDNIDELKLERNKKRLLKKKKKKPFNYELCAVNKVDW